MTYTITLVAVAIVAPMISAALLTRNLSVSSDRIRSLLATLVVFQLFELLAVQVLAVFQILDFLKSVDLPKIAGLQVAVLVATIAGKSFLPQHQMDRSKGESSESWKSWIRGLPSFVIVTGILVLGSHLVFAINMLTSYPSGWDGLAYHLPLSLRWLQMGTFDMPASRVWQLSMPGNTEIGMMFGLATGCQSLAVLFNCLALVVLALAVYVIADECSRDTIAAQLSVLVLLTIPLFQFQAYSAYVDLAGTAYLMAAIALFLPRNLTRSALEEQSMRSWSIVAISSVACGISIGTKAVFYVYAAFFMLIALIGIVRTVGYHKRFVVSAMLVMGLSAALPSAFWFWRAFHDTSNPIYPLQFSLGGHTLLRGYPSSAITPVDMVRSSTPSGWLFYPWTEKISNYDGPLLQYGLDSGLGGAFATFVPIGIAFCLYRCLKRAANGYTVILMACWIFAFGTWWFALRHYPRFGLPLWAMSCALSALLFSRFRRLESSLFRWLLVCSVGITCAISAFSPLHETLSRVRSGDYSRSAFYGYPAFLDQLPEGSRVLNKATKFNFELAGKKLTNQVIPDFDSPSEITESYLTDQRIDYVIESSDRVDHFDDLRSAGGKLVYDGWLQLGEGGARKEWRVWQVASRKQP